MQFSYSDKASQCEGKCEVALPLYLPQLQKCNERVIIVFVKLYFYCPSSSPEALWGKEIVSLCHLLVEVTPSFRHTMITPLENVKKVI